MGNHKEARIPLDAWRGKAKGRVFLRKRRAHLGPLEIFSFPSPLHLLNKAFGALILCHG
jgi:hypothetical protein